MLEIRIGSIKCVNRYRHTNGICHFQYPRSELSVLSLHPGYPVQRGNVRSPTGCLQSGAECAMHENERTTKIYNADMLHVDQLKEVYIQS
jgi:hypothetical protein